MEPIPLLLMLTRNHQVINTTNAKVTLLITKEIMISGLTWVCIYAMLIRKVGIPTRWENMAVFVSYLTWLVLVVVFLSVVNIQVEINIKLVYSAMTLSSKEYLRFVNY